MKDLSGTQIGPYRLLTRLGEGGFSEVYLGHHTNEDSKNLVAIKILKYANLKERDRKRFYLEAEIIKRLQHPNIVKILDTGIDNDVPFLVMEYAANGTLNHSRLPLPTIASYLTQLANALEYAHTQKVIHCDIKPENILLGAQGQLLLSDFGIAVIIHTSTPIDKQVTEEANPKILGTLRYMAPEQINGKPCNASDQYSLGIVAYEWLCEDPPFDGPPLHILAQHLNSPLPSLRERNPALPSNIEEVVFKALAKDPEKRFPSVTAFAQAFQDALFFTAPSNNSVPLTPPPVSPPPSPRPPIRAHILTSLITMLLTLAITFGSPTLFQGLSSLFFPPVSKIIKIGVDLPLSGEDGLDGQPILNAIKLAVAQSNIRPYALEVDAYDDVGADDIHDPSVGVGNVQKLINDAQVAGIVGPFNSNVALEELPVTNQALIAQISPSTTSTCLTPNTIPSTDYASICSKTPVQLRPSPKGQTTFFRTAATDAIVGTKFADYLLSQKYKTAVIIKDPGAYGNSFAYAFEKEWTSKGGITPIQDLVPSQTDQAGYQQRVISPILALNQPPDVVFYAGQTRSALLIHTLMERHLQLKKTVFAVGGGVMDAFASNIEGSHDGFPVYAVSPVGNTLYPDSDSNLNFYTSYISSYSDPPTTYAASAYDCTKILINALQMAMGRYSPPTGPRDISQAEEFRQAVIAAIPSNNTAYDGATGIYSFSNKSGDPDTGGTVTLYHFASTTQRWVWDQTL